MKKFFAIAALIVSTSNANAAPIDLAIAMTKDANAIVQWAVKEDACNHRDGLIDRMKTTWPKLSRANRKTYDRIESVLTQAYAETIPTDSMLENLNDSFCAAINR